MKKNLDLLQASVLNWIYFSYLDNSLYGMYQSTEMRNNFVFFIHQKNLTSNICIIKHLVTF